MTTVKMVKVILVLVALSGLTGCLPGCTSASEPVQHTDKDYSQRLRGLLGFGPSVNQLLAADESSDLTVLDMTDAQRVELLEGAYISYNHVHQFKPGDIVTWKPLMSHKAIEGPFIVHKVLDTPIFDTDKSSGSPYFNEPLDVVLCSIDSDADYVCYHYDSKRFQPYNR